MHQHNIDIDRECAQSSANRRLSSSPTGDDNDLARAINVVRQRIETLGRTDNDDHVNNCGERPDRMRDKGFAVQQMKRLRNTGTEAFASTGCRNDRGGSTWTQDARTSSSTASALSSLVFSAKANSLTRI